jgi:hypothetical protein
VTREPGRGGGAARMVALGLIVAVVLTATVYYGVLRLY